MHTKSRSGFTVPELLITCVLFLVLSTILFAALHQVSRVWYRSSSRDDALSQILKAKARLVRDLANSSSSPQLTNTTTVGPSIGNGFDGDALTFLSSDDGSAGGNWTADPSTGQATLACQITYYLVVPQATNRYNLTHSAGPADSSGYEQQFPLKWLVRRVDGVTPGPVLNPAWTSWLTRPTAMTNTPAQQVVADQLLQFRVIQRAPLWTVQIAAVAINDAMRQVPLGNIPLSQSSFTLVEQITVSTGN